MFKFILKLPLYLHHILCIHDNLLHKSIHHFPIKFRQLQPSFQYLQTCHFRHIHIYHQLFDILLQVFKHLLICLALFQTHFLIHHTNLVTFISFTQVLFDQFLAMLHIWKYFSVCFAHYISTTFLESTSTSIII